MSLFSRLHCDIAVAIGAIAAGLTSVACMGPFACTLVAWFEGLSVELVGPGGNLPEGAYEVEVVADGEPLRLTVDWTPTMYSCRAPEDDCLVEVALDDGRELRLQFEFDRIVVWYEDDDGLAGGPAEASVTMRRDGVVVGSDVFMPTYRESEPNGRGCGVATTATVELAID